MKISNKRVKVCSQFLSSALISPDYATRYTPRTTGSFTKTTTVRQSGLGMIDTDDVD